MKRAGTYLLAFAVFAFAGCRATQDSAGNSELLDSTQDQIALQGFRTYCSECHSTFTQAAMIRNNAARIRTLMTTNRMPPPGSDQAQALTLHQDVKQAMIAFASTPTPPPTDLPLSDVRLPQGFKISLFAKVPKARSLAVEQCQNGQAVVWVGTGGFAAPDTKVYGVIPDASHTFATTVKVMANNFRNPNGVAVVPGQDVLYVADPDRIVKFTGAKQALLSNALLGTSTTVLSGIPTSFGTPPQQDHFWKYLRYNKADNKLYYSIGSYANVHARQDPFATIMRVKTDGSQNEVFERGIRNSVGFDWQPDTGEFWFTDNGRDGMGDNVPADELNKATAPGQDFGFPYCHGGDTPDPSPALAAQGTCANSVKPQMKLAAHVAALGIRFYWSKAQVTQMTQDSPNVFKFPFPDAYRGQAFIAEHGSWNSSSPIGARVMLVKLSPDNKTARTYEPFATGFQSADGTRWGRPVDVAPYCDGSLLVSDDKAGAIYRIYYQP